MNRYAQFLIGTMICLIAATNSYSQSRSILKTSPKANPHRHDSSKWKSAIEQFEAAHKTAPKPRNAILFVGSSSIRLWDLKEFFPELIAINHGFGGSQLADSVNFIESLVLQHKPSSVVMYAGDNDINAGKSPARVFADFTEFVAILQENLPETTLHFVAIKPSINRWKLVAQNRRANMLIKTYCDLHDKLFFVDVDTPMLKDDGTLEESLFAKDGLHLSQEGYELWTDVLRKSINQPGATQFKLVNKNRRRVIVLTDITNEPDDEQSLVRFLCYANQFEVEGLIATTSCWLKDTVVPQKIIERVEAYGKVLPNLMKHAKGWPTKKQLMSKVKSGAPEFGMKGVGNGYNSSGSMHIVDVVDQPDPRPVHVSIWGGANCLAQALWHVKETRSEEELNAFVGKLRVYSISDQDDSGPWMRKEFPGLFYVVSPGQGEKNVEAYKQATWNGISGDKYLGKFSGPDFSIVDNPWLDKNIRKEHGPLGALHPETKYLMEGDTPSFLWLVQNGLNHPDNPAYGGWGGRYELYTPIKQDWHFQQVPRPIWTDALDTVKAGDGNEYRTNQATIWRWREAYQNDFAARIDWSNTNDPAKANHAPKLAIESDDSNSIIYKTVHSGKKNISFKTDVTDPDGNAVDLNWSQYKEAGTYQGEVTITVGDSRVSLNAPKVQSTKTIHLIGEAKDNGSPSLSAYRRIILTVQPSLVRQQTDQRPRVFITTDIDGEGDPDDHQSLCHLMLYADQLDIRGIVPDRFSPSGNKACETVMDKYEFDYNCSWTKFRQFGFPTPDEMRSLVLTDREVALERFVDEVHSKDPRPIYLLAWGDLEFAYDALGKTGNKVINEQSRVRLLSVATNKMAKKNNGNGLLKNWNSPGRDKLFHLYPMLWWIENDWTYNGMFVGPEPVEMKKYLANNAGKLGQHISDVVDAVDWADYFRAGDTPTVLYLLDKNHSLTRSWAGKFIRPFPESHPRFWTGNVGQFTWNHESPDKTWKNAEDVYDLRVKNFLKTRGEVYKDLKAKVALLYGTDHEYDQKQSLGLGVKKEEKKSPAKRVGPN